MGHFPYWHSKNVLLVIVYHKKKFPQHKTENFFHFFGKTTLCKNPFINKERKSRHGTASWIPMRRPACFFMENRRGSAPASIVPIPLLFYARLVFIILKHVNNTQRQKCRRYCKRHCADNQTRYLHFLSPPSLKVLQNSPNWTIIETGKWFQNKPCFAGSPPFAIFYHVHSKM